MPDLSLRQALGQAINQAAFSSPVVARFLTAFRRQRKADRRPATAWDRDFSGGFWDRLGDLDELAHHAVIAGYVARLNPNGYVLDVGCGAGVSEKLLRKWCLGYHGIDLSAVAVSKAQASAPYHARFTVTDADHFMPERSYDVIIMSEVAEYFTDLEAQMKRYAGYLTPGGHLIVSMWVSRRNFARWPLIDRALTLRDQTLVWNARHIGWMIKVYTP